MIVKKWDGTPWTLAEAQARYGFSFRRAEVPAGTFVYRLVEILEKTGTTGLQSEVVDQDGNPIHQADVAFYWPDAPMPPDPPTEAYSGDWCKNFVHGLTNVNGHVAPGMGHGAYHDGSGGPHAVWVRDKFIASDIAEKLGMLSGTFHDHVDLKFQLMIAGGNGGDTPMPLQIILVQEPWHDQTEGVNCLAIECLGMPDFFETRGDLLVGDDPNDPDWESEEPINPEKLDPDESTLNLYFQELWYIPGEGEQSRKFWFQIRDWKTSGHPIIGRFGPFETLTAGPGRIWHVKVEWGAPGDPDPGNGGDPDPDDPIPDKASLALLFRRMGQRLGDMKDTCERIADILDGTAS